MPYKVLQPYERVVETCPADSYFRSNVPAATLQEMATEFASTVNPEFTTFVGAEYDTHYLSNVGWEKINETNTGYRLFFSHPTFER
jgi:hypothetical protein